MHHVIHERCLPLFEVTVQEFGTPAGGYPQSIASDFSSQPSHLALVLRRPTPTAARGEKLQDLSGKHRRRRGLGAHHVARALGGIATCDRLRQVSSVACFPPRSLHCSCLLLRVWEELAEPLFLLLTQTRGAGEQGRTNIFRHRWRWRWRGGGRGRTKGKQRRKGSSAGRLIVRRGICDSSLDTVPSRSGGRQLLLVGRVRDRYPVLPLAGSQRVGMRIKV